MTITLVSPRAGERLVPVNTALIFDAVGETITSVVVDAVQVWNGVIPLAGWFALSIPIAGGNRLVLDQPSVMVSGSVINASVTGSVSPIFSYLFQVGLRQITTSDDASVPRIAEGGPAAPAPVTPAFSLTLDDVSGPPIDGQATYTFTQLGSPTWQQPGVVLPALKAVNLNGVSDALSTSTPLVNFPVYERIVTVNNLTAGVLTNMSIPITLDTAALISGLKMASNSGLEVRDNSNALVPYWMEGPANNAATVYWFKAASLAVGANTFKLRFSLSEAFPTSNAKASVFLFFDEFDGPSLDPQWTVTTGTPTIVGGQLQVDAGDGVFAGGFNVPHDTVIESLMRTNGSAVYGANTRISTTSGAGFVNEGGANIVGLLVYTNQRTYGETSDGSEGIFGPNYDISGALKKYRIDYRAGGTAFANFDYDNGAGSISRAETSSTNTMRPVIYNGSGQFFVNWVRVYKYLTGNVSSVQGSDTNIGTGSIPAIPNPDPLKLQKFSISGWFNPSSVSSQRAIASVGRSALKGWVVRILATNFIEFRIFNGTTSTAATSTTIAATGVWHHVVAVIDFAAGILRLYVDSNKEVDIAPTTSSAVYEALVDFFLGQDPVAAPDQFQGRLDQWKYFPGLVLTDGQVSLLFQESTGPLRTPWIGYSREPGNIYVRKDEPLTGEVLLVPGDKVDIGYDEAKNEIEIMYIHNGKVFLVTGQASENPSTLTQPSILKNDVKTGDIGTWEQANFSKADFPPIKLAVPIEPTITTGDIGTWEFATHSNPPGTALATGFVGSPATVVVGPASSSLITSVRLFKRAYGGVVFLAEFAASSEISVYLDYAFVEGDAYLTQSVYGDPGAPARQRLTAQSSAGVAGPGALMTTGNIGTWEQANYSQVNFPPLKLAVPIEPTHVTGDVGGPGDYAYMRSWFPPNAATAAMGASFDGFIVITGLTGIRAQHLGLNVAISGASNSTNNGAWVIVEIISATSVRVRALTAAGSDANNGALVWTITGTQILGPASFVSLNTINIGVG